MSVETFENYARFKGPSLQAWNDANAASIIRARMAVGRLELAVLTARFMTLCARADADFEGRVEPLVRRLEKLTEQYGEAYTRELRQLYSAWSDSLRDKSRDRNGE